MVATLVVPASEHECLPLSIQDALCAVAWLPHARTAAPTLVCMEDESCVSSPVSHPGWIRQKPEGGSCLIQVQICIHASTNVLVRFFFQFICNFGNHGSCDFFCNLGNQGSCDL
ncbi:hypothetical protein BDA96_05G146400 [Sorghum bicolor]|uniref:Uncharacterized protein n=1 Tax=Sorghum bicolor TaxID=4558 RepID=A0A921QYV9_SORBI|nr:hypothetical protein BDA96_05G146400 [Sorghum bicolor]